MKSLRRFIIRVQPMLPVWGLAAIGLVLGLIVMGSGAFLFHRAKVDALAQAQSADAVNRLRSAMDDRYRRRLQTAVRWLSLGASDLEEEFEPTPGAAEEDGQGADIAVGSIKVREPYERLRAALDELSVSAEASRAWGQRWRERQGRLAGFKEACDGLIQTLRSRIATHRGELALALASARSSEDHAEAERLSKSARRLLELEGALVEAIVQVARLLEASTEEQVAEIGSRALAQAFRSLGALAKDGEHASEREEQIASAVESLRSSVLGAADQDEESLAALVGERLAAQSRRSELRRELLGRVDACDSARAALETVLSGAPGEIQAAATATQRQALLITLAATGACGLGFLFASRAVARRLHKQLESLRAINADLHNSQLQLLQAQKLESIGQLAAGIAHEINTPAQYVSDNVRFLRDQFDPVMKVIDKYSASLEPGQAARSWAERSEEIKKVMDELDYEFVRREIPGAIEQSLEGLERISTIVRAMKDFSHPGSDVKQPADLNHAIESTVTVCKTRWKYVADLQLELDPNLPPVPCLLGEMNQVFLNLIVNAADAIGSKHGETHKGLIVVRTSMDGDYVEVAIEDNGGGIPESVQDRIFDPFFTTKGVGKGTGQGLAISRNVVVNKHRGVLEFWSTPGTGTTFVIRLPLHDQAAAPLKAAA